MIRLEVVDVDSGESEQAGLYDVCAWLIQTYPDDVFVSSEHPVHQMRDRAREVLAMRKCG